MSSELKTGPDGPASATLAAPIPPPSADDPRLDTETDLEVDEPHATGRLGSVFWTSVAVSAVFVVWAVAFTDNLNKVTTASLNWVTGSSAGPTWW